MKTDKKTNQKIKTVLIIIVLIFLCNPYASLLFCNPSVSAMKETCFKPPINATLSKYENYSIILSWKPYDGTNFSNYTIYKSLDKNFSKENITAIINNSSINSFKITAFSKIGMHYFKIETMLTNDSVNYSKIVKGYVPTVTKVILHVFYHKDKDEIELRWNPYNGTNFSRYRLYQSTSKDFQEKTEIANIYNQYDTSINITEFDKDTKYYFKLLTELKINHDISALDSTAQITVIVISLVAILVIMGFIVAVGLVMMRINPATDKMETFLIENKILGKIYFKGCGKLFTFITVETVLGLITMGILNYIFPRVVTP